MSTIARDTDLTDSTLPPGGRPAWDDEFLAWARGYCTEVNLAGLLLAQPGWAAFDLRRSLALGFPDVKLEIKPAVLNPWQLIGHLFKFLNGPAAYPHGIKCHHRLRFVAIRHHFQPELIQAEADRYVESLAAPARPAS
jgi:hypothetical protein